MIENFSSNIHVLQAELRAAKAEIEAFKAEIDSVKAENAAIKADAAATKAESEALIAEAEALKAEAEALMAEAEASKAEAEVLIANGKALSLSSLKPEPLVTSSSEILELEAKKKPQSESQVPPISGSIAVASLAENDKLPKDRIVLYPDEYQALGITNFKATAIKTYDYDGYSMFSINGEYDGKTSSYLIIIPMIYNSKNELIAADFDEKIKAKIRSHKTYSLRIEVPNNEDIARVEVRIIKDPVFLK